MNKAEANLETRLEIKNETCMIVRRSASRVSSFLPPEGSAPSRHPKDLSPSPALVAHQLLGMFYVVSKRLKFTFCLRTNCFLMFAPRNISLISATSCSRGVDGFTGCRHGRSSFRCSSSFFPGGECKDSQPHQPVFH